MTWGKGTRGWWGSERVEIMRPELNGTVDLQLIDDDGNAKPAATPGSVAYHENVSVNDLSHLSPAERQAKAEKDAADAQAKREQEAAAKQNPPAGDAK